MSDFSFTPKTEEELIDLLEVGDGDFEITKAERREKDGYPMFVLNLKVFDKNGKDGYMTDYLKLDTESNYCMRKIRHLCYSCGLGDLWERGKFDAADFLGKTGKLIIGLKKAGQGKDGKWYAESRNVRDYVNLEGMEDSMEQLKQRQAMRATDNNTPPVSAYDDIPV